MAKRKKTVVCGVLRGWDATDEQTPRQAVPSLSQLSNMVYRQHCAATCAQRQFSSRLIYLHCKYISLILKHIRNDRGRLVKHGVVAGHDRRDCRNVPATCCLQQRAKKRQGAEQTVHRLNILHLSCTPHSGIALIFMPGISLGAATTLSEQQTGGGAVCRHGNISTTCLRISSSCAANAARGRFHHIKYLRTAAETAVCARAVKIVWRRCDGAFALVKTNRGHYSGWAASGRRIAYHLRRGVSYRIFPFLASLFPLPGPHENLNLLFSYPLSMSDMVDVYLVAGIRRGGALFVHGKTVSV